MCDGHLFVPIPFFYLFISLVHFSIGYLGLSCEFTLTVYFGHLHFTGHLC